jgi:hypothetical protein
MTPVPDMTRMPAKGAATGRYPNPWIHRFALAGRSARPSGHSPGIGGREGDQRVPTGQLGQDRPQRRHSLRPGAVM